MANGSDTDLEQVGDEEGEEAEPSNVQLLAVNPFHLNNFSKLKTRYMALFDVERWAAELEGLTFPTATMPLSWEEGLAIVHHFQECCCGHKEKVTEADRAALRGFQRRLSDLLKGLQEASRSGAFFVRLGPRSPKDAPLFASEPYGISTATIVEALSTAVCQDPHDVHCVLQCFEDVSYSLLRVTSAEEAAALLVSSSRIMQDISRTRDHGEAGWSMSVVARSWEPRVRLEREFRGFVAGDALTAVSQYNNESKYDFVIEHLDEILATIQRCFDCALSRLRALGHLTCVVDFVVFPPEDVASEAWEACIVEVNPFGPMTGSSLFAYEADRRLLQGGRDIYGDLSEWELKHPPASRLPPHVAECKIGDVTFRYCKEHAPGYTWDKLQAFWETYCRLAPRSVAAVP